jgi:hypothetical protein
VSRTGAGAGAGVPGDDGALAAVPAEVGRFADDPVRPRVLPAQPKAERANAFAGDLNNSA